MELPDGTKIEDCGTCAGCRIDASLKEAIGIMQAICLPKMKSASEAVQAAHDRERDRPYMHQHDTRAAYLQLRALQEHYYAWVDQACKIFRPTGLPELQDHSPGREPAVSELQKLARAYADACAAVASAWRNVKRTYPASPDRDDAIRYYNDCRRDVAAARDALLTFTREGHSEVGTE